MASHVGHDHPATPTARAACRKATAGPRMEMRDSVTGMTREETVVAARIARAARSAADSARGRMDAHDRKAAERRSKAARDTSPSDADVRYLARLSAEVDTPRPSGTTRIITDAESREFWGPRNAAFKAEMVDARRTGRCRACGKRGHLNCPGR